MAKMVGRNVNSNDTATVTSYALNSVTATTIAAANNKRIHISACLDYGITDEDVAIRLYPAATDATVRGEILTRRTASNDSLFRPSWTMNVDNVYTGEISAITASGLITIHVTEY